MTRLDVPEGLEHRILDAGVLPLELHQHPLRPLTLQPEIAACGTAAADDRQLALFGVRTGLVLANEYQRPDHDMCAVVGQELRRHGFERTGEEEIQQQRLNE